MELIAELRRLHWVEKISISELAKRFNLFPARRSENIYKPRVTRFTPLANSSLKR